MICLDNFSKYLYGPLHFPGCQDYLDSSSCEAVTNNCQQTCGKCNGEETSPTTPEIISTTRKPTKATTKKPTIPHKSVIWGELRKNI